MTDTTSQITTWISDASEALGLFPSVIKSGEAWSSVCEEVRARARDAVTRLGEAAMRGAAPALVASEAVEAAWRDGWATCKATLTEDEAFCLTDDVEQDAWLDSATAALARAGGDGWRGMGDAPRDGSYILAIVAPNRGRYLEHQAGRAFVIRHEGLLDSYDMGWAVYPGFGGASDHDFTVWRPLPAAPDAGEDGRG